MLVKDLLKAGLIATSVVSCVALADEVVSVEADSDAQSYSTQTTDSKSLKERNENIDVAREPSIDSHIHWESTQPNTSNTYFSPHSNTLAWIL